MKLYNNPLIVVPWFDTTGMKQRSHMIFKGELSHKRLRREVKRFIKDNFGNAVTNEYVDALITANTKAYQVMRERIRTVTDEQVEAWISRISDDDETDPEGEEGVTE